MKNFSKKISENTCIFCGAPNNGTNFCIYCGSYYLTQKQFEEKLCISEVINIKNILSFYANAYNPEQYYVIHQGLKVPIRNYNNNNEDNELYLKIINDINQDKIIKQVFEENIQKNFTIKTKEIDMFISKGLIKSIMISEHTSELKIYCNSIYIYKRRKLNDIRINCNYTGSRECYRNCWT